jgi:hypothetical protein
MDVFEGSKKEKDRLLAPLLIIISQSLIQYFDVVQRCALLKERGGLL